LLIGHQAAWAADACPEAMTDKAFTFWDHVYADNTPARIEIGDSADRDSCTRLEIQLPTSWAYGSAEFILRFGPEFAADDTVWVFIHTDADSVNAEGKGMVLE
ncbi:MAG TPA: hypothetical protein VMY40_10945, partial [Anaerolineae bacterium]|nr:hypothetical protein [Anaerolineae bacterium]